MTTAAVIHHGTYTLATVLAWTGAGCIIGAIIATIEQLSYKR